jgi:hypothetical protein
MDLISESQLFLWQWRYDESADVAEVDARKSIDQ